METSHETAMDNFVKNSATNARIKANNIEMTSLLERMRVLSKETGILSNILELETRKHSFEFQVKKAETGNFYTKEFQAEILNEYPMEIEILGNKIKSLKDLLK